MYDGIARVLRPGGVYHQSAWNPLAYAADASWTGRGYLLREGYVEGREFEWGDAGWDLTDPAGALRRLPGPREFRHTLTATVNGLLARGFLVLQVEEGPAGDPDAEPGSWEHFCTIAPPWLTIWAALRPDLARRARSGE